MSLKHGEDVCSTLHCVELCVLVDWNVSSLKSWQSMIFFFFSRNKGEISQDLVSCRLAGWDKAQQFRFEAQGREQTCSREAAVSVPEGENVNSLNHHRENRTDEIPESNLENNTENSPGKWCSCCSRRSRNWAGLMAHSSELFNLDTCAPPVLELREGWKQLDTDQHVP